MVPRLAFVQQVFGSEWARHSHACIRRGFPDAPIIQVRGVPSPVQDAVRRLAQPILRRLDASPSVVSSLAGCEVPKAPAAAPLAGPERPSGPLQRLRLALRYKFDPLRPLLRGLRLDVDYVVHIDEDCFLTDPTQLLDVISQMDRDPSVLVAGPADGGTPFRDDRNPLACNLFFNVLKRDPVAQLMHRNSRWRSLRVSDLPVDQLANPPQRGTYLRPASSTNPFMVDDHEPYYPLYWLVLSNGYQIQYLPVYLTADERRASAIRLPGRTTDLCFHMWYMREWIRGIDNTVHGIRNNRRYECAREHLASLLDL